MYGLSYFDLTENSVTTSVLCVLDGPKSYSTVGPFVANTAQLNNIAQLAMHMANCC